MSDTFRKVHLKRVIYPTMIVMYAIVVAFVLSFTIRYLTSKFNAIFALDQEAIESERLKVDLSGFRLVSNKLRSLSVPSTPPVPVETVVGPTTTPTSSDPE